MGLGLTLFLAAACHRDLATAGSGAEGHAPSSAPTPVEDDNAEAKKVVLAWSDALDRHEVSGLDGLYGERVRYYGRDLAKASVVEGKRRALAGDATFHQQILGDITAVSVRGASTTTFQKRSGPASRMRDVQAKVVLRRDGAGKLVIVEETDDVTEKAVAKQERSRCEEVASKVVNDLPEVKKAVAAAMKGAEGSDGAAHFGGVDVDDSDSPEGFTRGIGLHTAERFTATVWYSVDGEGRLSVTVSGSDVTIGAKAMSAVEAACAPSRPR
jgi:hypothetical protein